MAEAEEKPTGPGREAGLAQRRDTGAKVGKIMAQARDWEQRQAEEQRALGNPPTVWTMKPSRERGLHPTSVMTTT